MKIPWKKRVRITLTDELLKGLIKDLLSDFGRFEHRSMFQTLIIDLYISDIDSVRKDIAEWLDRRC